MHPAHHPTKAGADTRGCSGPGDCGRGVRWAAEPMSIWVKEAAHPETHPPGASSPRLASLAAWAQHLPSVQGPQTSQSAPGSPGPCSRGRAEPHQGNGRPSLGANPQGSPGQCLRQTSPPTETGGPGWVADGRHLQSPKGELENSSNSGSNLLRNDTP